MDYVDDAAARPRFQFQTRPSSDPSAAPQPHRSLIKIGKLPAAACFAAAALLLLLSTLYLPADNDLLSFLLVWISLSLLAGPFAPPSLTFGDPVIGRGAPLPPSPSPAPSPPDSDKKHPIRRPRSHLPETPTPLPPPVRSIAPENPKPSVIRRREEEDEEKEWTDEDFEILKKQIAKHPVGVQRRWERIAEAFRGRHGLESVIRTAKSLSEKRPGAEDSFAQFLKQRKPLDKRAEAVDGDSALMENSEKKEGWSSGEDIALLNALKAFPKDAPLRWEKIAAAVPGKTKACCMKRVSELKRDFRSSKGSET